MPLIQVLAHCRVLDSAGFVRATKAEARALPLREEPLLQRHPRDPRLGDVLNADLSDHRESSNSLRVDIASDVADALVPNVTVHVAPAVLLKDRMRLVAGLYAGKLREIVLIAHLAALQDRSRGQRTHREANALT